MWKHCLLPKGCLNRKKTSSFWFSFLKRFNSLLECACHKQAKKEDSRSEKWNLQSEKFSRWLLKDQHVQINKADCLQGHRAAVSRWSAEYCRHMLGLLLVYISMALGWLRNPSAFNENPIVSESERISVSPFLCGCNTFQTVWAALCNLGTKLSALIMQWMLFFFRGICAVVNCSVL